MKYDTWNINQLASVLGVLALALLTSGCFTSQSFISVQSGIWEDGATWGNNSPGNNGTDYPSNRDSVTISPGHTVTHNNNELVNYLSIGSLSQLNSLGLLRIRGAYTNNGTHTGTGEVRVQNVSDTISGIGTISTTSPFRVDVGSVIAQGSILQRSNSTLRCPNNATLLNLGTLNLNGASLDGNGTTTFVNGPNSVLFADQDVLVNGTLEASAIGNTVVYDQATGVQDIKIPASSYYDLTLDGNTGSQKSITSDLVVDNDLNLQGTELLFNGLDSLDLYGSLTNSSGIFSSSTENLRLLGTANQSLSGDFDLYDLTIDKSSGTVTLNTDTTSLHGVLNVRNGTLDANGLLRLVSNAQGDASVAPVGGSVIGDVTVERYIDPGATGWRFMTAPVTGAIFADWNDDFITSGYPGSSYPNFPFTSVLKYDESVVGHQDSGLIAPSSASEAISSKAAYWVWSGDGSTNTNEFTVDVTGEILSGSIDLAVNYTITTGGLTADGWSLVANPYVCTIDWDDPSWTKVFVDDAVYVWNTDQGQYASYIAGVSTNGGSNFIASSQGFYVKTTALFPQLTVAEQAKVSDTTVTFLKKQVVDPIIRLSASYEGFVEESVLRFREGASTEFDGALDAYYLSYDHYPIKMYTEHDSVLYSINSIEPDLSDTIQVVFESPYESIPLHVKKNELAKDYCVVLEDTKDNILTPLIYDEDDLLLDNTTKDARRYRLIISAPDHYENSLCHEETPIDTGLVRLKEPLEEETYCFCEGSTLHWSGKSILNEPYVIWSIDGKCIARGVVSSNEIQLPNFVAGGIYFLEISDQKKYKFFKP